jgi:hypothetical protein
MRRVIMKRRCALLVCMTVCGAALFAQITAVAIYVGNPPVNGAGAYDVVLRDLYDATDWITEYAEDGGHYTIIMGKDEKTDGLSFEYGDKKVAITLKAAGGMAFVSMATQGRR